LYVPAIPRGPINSQNDSVAIWFHAGWDSHSPPATPVYLFRWQDDSSNLIDVRFESGYFKLRRMTNAGSEEATLSAIFNTGDELLVFARWSSTGLWISKNGSNFLRNETVLSDDFARADGPLGTATTGQTWTHLDATGQAQITSQRMVQVTNPTHEGITISGPAKVLRGRFSFTGSLDNSAVVIATSPDGAHPFGPYSNMVHFVTGAESYSVNFYANDTPSANLLSAPQTLLTDGTIYSTQIMFDGNWLRIDVPAATRVASDTRSSTLPGTFLFYQLFKSGTLLADPRWEDIAAEVQSSTPTGGRYAPALNNSVAHVAPTNDVIGNTSSVVRWYAVMGQATDADAARLYASGSSGPSAATAGSTCTALWHSSEYNPTLIPPSGFVWSEATPNSWVLIDAGYGGIRHIVQWGDPGGF
jgi:hypothetical protein